MPFLHLPIQSGSNKILKRMNRKHNRTQYLNLIKKIKKIVPQMAFSSDFIIGYPGETDEDFEKTINLINDVKFASSYSFIYSPRPEIPASVKKDNISHEIKKERLNYLQKILLNIKIVSIVNYWIQRLRYYLLTLGKNIINMSGERLTFNQFCLLT